MTGLYSGEDLAGVAGENLLFHGFGENLKLGSSEAGLGNVSVLRDNFELLSNRNGGLLGVTSDHDDVHTSGFAILDSTGNFGSDGVLNANVAEEGKSALVVLVLSNISELLLSVIVGDILHVSTIEADSETEDTVAVGGD